MPLLTIEDRISKAIKNNNYLLGIFLDVAKAFDYVKLGTCGIRGIQLNWFISYLQNRSQLVLVFDYISNLE